MSRAKKYSRLCTATNEQMSNLPNLPVASDLTSILTMTSKEHLGVLTDTIKIITNWPLFYTEEIYPQKDLIFHTVINIC